MLRQAQGVHCISSLQRGCMRSSCTWDTQPCDQHTEKLLSVDKRLTTKQECTWGAV